MSYPTAPSWTPTSKESKWAGEGRGGSGRRLLALQKTLHSPSPPFTTAFLFYKTDGKTNKRRAGHASFTRRTKRNTERSFIYTVLCTDMIPNNFSSFFFFKCVYGRSGVFLLRVDESARVQGGGSGRITREQVDSSDTAAKIERDADVAVFIVCLRFLFFSSVC